MTLAQKGAHRRSFFVRMRLLFRLRAFSDESDLAQNTARGLSIGWHLRSLAAACAPVLFLQGFYLRAGLLVMDILYLGKLA